MVWLDVCKGICIILVVFGHVSGGLEATGTLAPNSVWISLRQWVYLFHMPAFFVLSGIFAPQLSQLSFGAFFRGRLRTIVYPYVVWTIIIVGAQFAMARFVNNPPDFLRAAYFLIEPYGYGLWFLYSLFIISSVFYILGQWKIPTLFLLLLATVLSLLASLNVFGFWPILNTSMSFFIYYAAAACAREKIIALPPVNGWLKPLLLGFVGLLLMTILYWVIAGAGWLFNLLLAGLGIIGVIYLAKGLAQTIASRVLAFLGLFSLEIYLAHPLWGTVSRVLLLHLKINSPAILVLGGVLLGVGGSLMIGVLCRIVNFPYLFKWPTKVATKP